MLKAVFFYCMGAFFLLLSNSCNTQNKDNSSLAVNEEFEMEADASTNEKDLIDLDWNEFSNSKDTLFILNQDMSNFAKIYDYFLFIDDSKYDLRNMKSSELDILNKIRVRYFDPEYDVFVAQSLSINNDYYTVKIGNEAKLIARSGDYLTAMSYEDFIKSNLIKLNERTPLKQKSSDSSDTVDNYQEYTYEAVEFAGEWLKVKTVEEIDGVEFFGWVRWKDKDEILIDIAYSI